MYVGGFSKGKPCSVLPVLHTDSSLLQLQRHLTPDCEIVVCNEYIPTLNMFPLF